VFDDGGAGGRVKTDPSFKAEFRVARQHFGDRSWRLSLGRKE
jgi:hypothetical protein